MEILIVSATFPELKGLLPQADSESFKGASKVYEIGNHSVTFLVAGIGSVATAFHLGQHLVNNKYDLLINVGIAGTFRTDWELGKVVHVTREYFADLGAEDHEKFIDLFDMGLQQPNQFPFTNNFLELTDEKYLLPVNHLQKATGITVNKVHGHAPSITAIKNKFPESDIETMEGAAFFYCCIHAQLPALEIRAISNYVEPRNRENWKIDLALKNLWKAVQEII